MTNQSLLHVGRIKEKLEALAAQDGMRWQELARQVLLNYVNMKDLEAVTAQLVNDEVG